MTGGRRGLAALLLFGPAAGTGAQPPSTPAALAPARQLVLVTATHWNATAGTLHRYAREHARDAWRPVGEPVPVVLGRGGLGWGVGQGAPPGGTAPEKREGDGRAPAGAFPLLDGFGFATGAAPTPRPRVATLLAVTPSTVCVDDPGSAQYNAVIDAAAAPRVDWTSAERMRQVAGYRLGVVVDYNGARVGARAPAGRATAGRGSCIFLHVWDGPAEPTAGCTAMAADALAAVVAWLDPGRRPVLVQLPAAERARLRRAWRLP